MEDKALLMTKQAYTAYRSFIKTKPKSLKVQGRDNLYSIHTAFWKVVQEMMLESTGGVLLDKMGYFFIMKTPKKIKSSKKRFNVDFETYNLHTDGYMFIPSFLPCKRSPFIFWNIDGQFGKAVKRTLNQNLRAGYLYKMHANSLRIFLKIDNEQNRRNNSADPQRFK